MTTTTRAGTDQSQMARASFWVSHLSVGAQESGHLPLFSQAHQLRAGSEPQQLCLGPTPIQDVIVTGGSLTCYSRMLAPFTKFFKYSYFFNSLNKNLSITLFLPCLFFLSQCTLNLVKLLLWEFSHYTAFKVYWPQNNDYSQLPTLCLVYFMQLAGLSTLISFLWDSQLPPPNLPRKCQTLIQVLYKKNQGIQNQG